MLFHQNCDLEVHKQNVASSEQTIGEQNVTPS
jgi:hypothetical protein